MEDRIRALEANSNVTARADGFKALLGELLQQGKLGELQSALQGTGKRLGHGTLQRPPQLAPPSASTASVDPDTSESCSLGVETKYAW